MRKIALRGIRTQFGRFLLSVLAVLLGVAFVTGTFALRTMMSSTFHGIVDSSMVGDAYLRGAQDANVVGSDSGGVGVQREPVPLTLADQVADVPGVARALPDISGPAVLVGADGTAVSGGGAPSFATAYYPDDPSGAVVNGHAPEGTGEIALETRTLEASGLAVGDTATVVLGGQVQQVTISGEVEFGAPMAGATIMLVDPAVARTLYAPTGTVAQIPVYAQDGVSQAELVSHLQSALAGDTAVEAVTGDDARAELRESIDEMLGFMGTFLMVFAAIALFVGGFIIANTFAMSVRQRQREFAMLRAVGASPAQVFASILTQAAVVGLLGSALGIAAGLGLVSLLRLLFEQMGMELSGAIPLEPSSVVVSLILGTVVSVVSAAVPARRAALVPPVEAMRDELPAADRGMRWRALIGGAIVVGGATAAVISVVDDSHSLTMLGLGGAAVLVGMLALAPALSHSVLSVLAWPFVVAFRPLGRLARGNVTRNPRRTASTAAALMIGMALVGAVTVVAASTKSSVKSVVAQESDADFVLTSAFEGSMLPSGAVSAVEALPDVAQADPLTFTQMRVDGELTAVVGLPPRAFDRAFTLTQDAGSLATLADGQVAVQKSYADDKGLHVGDTVHFEGNGAVDATIGAVVTSHAIGSPYIVPDSLYAQLSPTAPDEVDTLLVLAKDGVAQEDLRSELVDVAKPYIVVSVMDGAEFGDSVASQVDQLLVILYALLGLSVVIAVLGVVNTLILSIAERTREIGLLRAVGLGQLQLAGTITIESILTALFGTVLGLAIGVGLASALPTLLADDGLSDLVIPWAPLAWMLVGTVVLGVLAALWPARRAARLPVLEAISYE